MNVRVELFNVIELAYDMFRHSVVSGNVKVASMKFIFASTIIVQNLVRIMIM